MNPSVIALVALGLCMTLAGSVADSREVILISIGVGISSVIVAVVGIFWRRV